MSESLYYIQREPKNAPENAPLLILLHGYGSHEQDLFSFAEELPEELRIISVRAPHSIAFGGYAWYAINFDADENKFSDLVQARESLIEIKSLISDLQEKYTPSKTFLLGFSQGAILSYAFSFNYPDIVDHVVALSGYLIEDLFPKEIEAKFKLSSAAAERLIAFS